MSKLDDLRKWFLLLVMSKAILFPFTNEHDSDLHMVANHEEDVEVSEDLALSEQLDDILAADLLNGAIAGVSVRGADTSQLIYSHDGDIRLRPASNMKVLTSIAALETLGPDYQYQTNVFTDGEITDNTLQGHLYIQGKGDPTLLKTDFDLFAKNLKSQGIHHITGDLIGDDYWYDDVRLSQDLNWSDEQSYVGAPISALTVSPNEDYDVGTVIINVVPGAYVGEEPDIKITPETDYVTIINKAETVDSYDKKDISVQREHGTNDILIEGTIPVGSFITESWMSVWEPTTYAVTIFKQSLAEEGITLSKNSHIKRKQTPKDAILLTSKQSKPLKDILMPFMKLSNNGLGDMLTKEMGQVVHEEGSWNEGLKVITDVVTTLGVDPDKILLRDGSGMSHKNLIPADELSSLLSHIQEEPWFPVFEKSLPVAGEQDRLMGGTLSSRMTHPPLKGNIKAKTGSLTGVSTLAGYVTAKSGEKLVFSILINNYQSGWMHAVHEELLTVLAEHEFTD